MTVFDVIILGVVALSALLAFARGFVREALSMAALFVAVLAVLWGFPVFREPMRGMIETGWLADVATVGGIFLLVYIAVRVGTGRIHVWVHDSEPLGILDRTAGLLFGVARGFVLMAIGALVVTSIAPTSMLPKSFKEAQFYPVVMLTADGLKHLAPEAGQAATDMARGAAKAGEDLAESRSLEQKGLAEDGTNAESSVDGGAGNSQKASDTAPSTEKSRSSVPDWKSQSTKGAD